MSAAHPAFGSRSAQLMCLNRAQPRLSAPQVGRKVLQEIKKATKRSSINCKTGYHCQETNAVTLKAEKIAQILVFCSFFGALQPGETRRLGWRFFRPRAIAALGLGLLQRAR